MTEPPQVRSTRDALLLVVCYRVLLAVRKLGLKTLRKHFRFFHIKQGRLRFNTVPRKARDLATNQPITNAEDLANQRAPIIRIRGPSYQQIFDL